MAPVVKKAFLAFVEDIPDSKINWQNYAHGQSKDNIFQNDTNKEMFRMDLQKFTKDNQGADPDDNYFQLAVQLNRKGGKATSHSVVKDLKKGRLGPVYASLKIHHEARPNAETFKDLLRKAGARCHEQADNEPISYCIQIEPDCSWRNHQTGETGQGTNFQP
ncbi:hypothetical protein MPH_02208 [Macrophomina phaseolina MS6]|uniref:Uncharacterized protein n=1 Tax=Macrophomina phaseolina (strain MS6) TaxID=1126212 RepID=K2SV22_MACPH|nr:hypothetical protein MPH_02208 [Macrophomina phaseolina MS6]